MHAAADKLFWKNALVASKYDDSPHTLGNRM
jgi:hypothetical protein